MSKTYTTLNKITLSSYRNEQKSNANYSKRQLIRAESFLFVTTCAVLNQQVILFKAIG